MSNPTSNHGSFDGFVSEKLFGLDITQKSIESQKYRKLGRNLISNVDNNPEFLLAISSHKIVSAILSNKLHDVISVLEVCHWYHY